MEKLDFGLRTSNKWNCVWNRTNVIEKAITCKNVKIPLAGQIDSEIRSAGRFAMRIQLMIEINRRKKMFLFLNYEEEKKYSEAKQLIFHYSLQSWIVMRQTAKKTIQITIHSSDRDF